jgi:esterase/lipase superfamily enzyme
MNRFWPIVLLAPILATCAPAPAPEQAEVASDSAASTDKASEAEPEFPLQAEAEREESVETQTPDPPPAPDRQEPIGTIESGRPRVMRDAPIETHDIFSGDFSMGVRAEVTREPAAVRRSVEETSDLEVMSATVPPPQLVDKNLRYVRIYYGTNRARTAECLGAANVRWDASGSCLPNNFYAVVPAERSAADSGLEVGTLAVTFPPGHQAGRIERPLQIFSFSLREDPEDHVLISELEAHAKDYPSWVRDLQDTGRTQAFIYVHGFGTTFDQAARRAAQVAFDLDFDQEEDFRGVPMMYSWPSNGKETSATAYASDYDRAIAEDAAFNQFLDLIKTDAGIERVHLIAHSMGNLVVAGALERRTRAPEPIISQLALAAPDIPAALFKARFLKVLPGLAERVTLYVSDSDKALIASSKLRQSEPRAGQVRGGLLETSSSVEDFDGIDASDLPTDFLAHSYWANNDSMLADIYCLLKGAPAEQRPLLVLAGAAWSFKSPELLRSLDASVCTASVALAVPRSVKGSGWSWRQFGLVLLVVAFVVFLILRKRSR